MKSYDVVVIGAGPSGTTASLLLKRKGYNVLLVDKAKFPREKLCGGTLTNKTHQFLKERLKIKKKELDQVIKGSTLNYRLFYKKELIYEGKSTKPFRIVDRKSYDYLLLKKVKEEGVEVKEGIDPKIDLEKRKINLEKEIVNYKVLIGADGANSKVRSLFPKELTGFKRFLNNLVLHN
jgi:flavin-dependent dehydrogenase